MPIAARRPTFCRTRIVRLAAFLAVLCLLSLPSNASAYSVDGGRWSNQPTSGCCLYLLYSTQYTSQSYDVTGWNNGASAWSNSTANVLYLSGGNDLGLEDTYDKTVTWDGLTTLYNGIYPCEGSGCKWILGIVQLNYFYTAKYSAGEIQSVAAHELGHVASLEHVMSCVLMNPYTSGTGARWSSGCNYINTPKSDDINGANSQY